VADGVVELLSGAGEDESMGDGVVESEGMADGVIVEFWADAVMAQ
jgi:hypothetical protein